MPFKMTPLAWVLGISMISNAITAVAVLYIAVGTPKVYVNDGHLTVYSGSRGIDIDDHMPIRVVIVGGK